MIEESVRYSATQKTGWCRNGYHHEWSCDSDYYIKHKKELDWLLPKYGFKPFCVRKLKDGKRYYTPVIFRKD